MTEYIERETAIKNIKEHQCRNCSDIGLCENCAVLTAIKLFENIPAADVITRDEGIRIGAELAAMHGSDATSQDLEKAYWRGFEDAMQKRDVQPVKWISVTERLPEKDGTFITAYSKGGVSQNWYMTFHHGGGKWYQNSEDTGEVTHWMPLPEPPKDGET